MRKFLTTILTVLLTIILLGGIAAGIFCFLKFVPTKKQADQKTWFQAEGDQVAIFLDNELVKGVHGRSVDGEIYLPLTWVNENLNERFYWDQAGKQLIYALPETIVYADAGTMGSSGRPLLVEQDGEVLLLSSLVATYTDLRMARPEGGEVQRIFVDTSWDPFLTAQIRKEGKVRTQGGGKSPILAEVKKGETVDVLETLDKWTRVRTESGYVGYIQSRLLTDTTHCTPVSTFQAPVYTSISMDEPVCMVWHQVTSPEANQKMPELMARTDGVNVIAPTWFMLTDNDGSFDSLADRDYVDKAHDMGIQVWAALDNFNRGDNVNSAILFASTDARQRLITSLMKEVDRYGIDGINLDIEGIREEAGPHYVQFIRELSVSCRKEGIVLSVDTYVPSAYTAFYNRAEQGRVADYVVIMGYDEHYAGGEAGSVASLEYERTGIENTLKQVPAEKIISAVPFYTRLWVVGKDGKTTSTAMGIANAKKWVAENQVKLTWQENLGQYYGEKDTEDGICQIWLEEEDSMSLKVKLVRDYRLAGIACWKLGFDTESIWGIVKQAGR